MVEDDLPVAVVELPYAAQTICAKVLHVGLLLRDAADAIQVRAYAIAQHLRQASVEIEGVIGGHTVNGLPQAVINAIVRKRIGVRPADDLRRSIRLIVCKGARAVVQEIAVVVPSVSHSVHICQAIGCRKSNCPPAFQMTGRTCRFFGSGSPSTVCSPLEGATHTIVLIHRRVCLVVLYCYRPRPPKIVHLSESSLPR